MILLRLEGGFVVPVLEAMQNIPPLPTGPARLITIPDQPTNELIIVYDV
jgi:hypothetical protein